MATIEANGTTLHYERRGSGPPVLFISGAAGDADVWSAVADALASDFTVVTYDRRGNSRSPRPDGWTVTSVGEQANDAAALLRGLDLAPAVVCGNSAGAMFANELLLRHPELVQAAAMHEPPYVGVSSDPAQVVADLQALMEAGMSTGGPAAAMDMFLRYVAPDEVIDALDPALLDRMLGDGEVFFTVELPELGAYMPDEKRLAEVNVPCLVTAGTDNRDPASRTHYLYEASQWLAQRLDTALVELPGGHFPHLTHPSDYVGALQPILDRVR